MDVANNYGWTPLHHAGLRCTADLQSVLWLTLTVSGSPSVTQLRSAIQDCCARFSRRSGVALPASSRYAAVVIQTWPCAALVIRAPAAWLMAQADECLMVVLARQVNAVTAQGHTAVHVAAMYGHVSLAAELLERPSVDPRIRDHANVCGFIAVSSCFLFSAGSLSILAWCCSAQRRTWRRFTRAGGRTRSGARSAAPGCSLWLPRRTVSVHCSCCCCDC